MDLSYLFGSTAPESVTSTTTAGNDNGIPIWLSDFTRGLMAKSVDVASQPYQPYGGPRIADFTPQQQQAFGQVQQNQGVWNPYLNQAGAAYSAGMNSAAQGAQTVAGAVQPFSQQQINPFLSPYISGVVEEMGRLGTRQYQEEILPRTLDPFIGGGQFGSTRSMDFANRAARDFGADLAGRQGQALQSAYDAAMNQYGNWAQRGIQGGSALGTLGQQQGALGQQFGALGQLRSQLGYQDATALEAAGRAQQQMNQQNYQLAYDDFLQQRDYPKANIEFLNQVVRGLPMDTQRYSTSSQVSPNYLGTSPLAQAGSAALALDNLRKQLGIT